SPHSHHTCSPSSSLRLSRQGCLSEGNNCEAEPLKASLCLVSEEMSMMNKHDVSAEPKPRGPYAMVGAGEITSSISRTGDPVNGFHYRFNLYSLRQADGQVENLFGPKDLSSIVKTAHVLGLFLLDEGW